MTKHPKKQRHYVRHDPYERALSLAKVQLEKFTLERDRITKRLEEINARIPKLRGIIRALDSKPSEPKMYVQTVEGLSPLQSDAAKRHFEHDGASHIEEYSPDDDLLPDAAGAPVLE